MKVAKPYPNINDWMADGCIEIGHCDYGHTRVTARLLDEGGTIWETTKRFGSLEEVLDALEAAIGDWYSQAGIE